VGFFGLKAIAAAFLLMLACAGLAYAAGPQEDVRDANQVVQRSIAAAQRGDLSAARGAYNQYDNTWSAIEEGVRASSRDAYRAIERAMDEVATAFDAQPVDAERVIASLSALDREQQSFITGTAPSSTTDASTTPSSSSKPTVGTLLDLLGKARSDVLNGDYATANARLKTFESTWLDVEGDVKTRSADAYRQTETDMVLAASLASQNSPETLDLITRMAARLEPFREAQRYGIFDATIILLREGLEALLVMVALSAFLKKAGNAAGQRWLWTGASAGVLVSVALGVAIQAFFGAVINPSNRELLEGVIGLFAAAMLVYVSYWLHSKASLGGWQAYIKERTTQAVAGGQLFGLAVLAFLAVFREGGETALFYLGMASNISNTDLLIGLALGVVLLVALGFLMVVVGVRIPMRPFFTAASVLVFYLCFKFTGTGIHALQVAGVLPDGSASFLASVDAVGVYPTWPTTIAQVALLVLAACVLLRGRLRSTSTNLSRVLASLFMLSLTACTTSAPAAPPAATTTKTTAAGVVPPAPALTSGRKEAQLVAGPRRRLEEMMNALQAGDIAATRSGLDAFDSDWNGIEVYVNFRSRALYGEIESHYEANIADALGAPQPDPAKVVPMLREMIAEYDQAIQLSDSGPALSPLFDDLAAVRIARAPLRTVTPALKAGNNSAAVTAFGMFKSRWPEARALMHARSVDAERDTDAALAAADEAFSAASVNAADAAARVDRLLDRYNYGVSLLNAAARNADVLRTSFSEDDVRSAAVLGALQDDLRKSLTRWDGGDHASAAEAARAASEQRLAPVLATLQARAGADAPLQKALDAYVVAANQGTDGEQVHAANKAAIEAVAIGQQVVAGQFWTDSTFQTAYKTTLASL
jgi:high-affinity iron transporter